MIPISQSELTALLADTARTEPTAAPAKPAPSFNDKRTRLHGSLGHLLPALWRKSQEKANHLTPREQHDKFKALIEWAAKKQNWTLTSGGTVAYWSEGQKKEGRVEYRLSDNHADIYLEIAWRKSRTPIEKLRAASIAGHSVLWLIAWPLSAEDAKALRRYADAVCGKATAWWLPILHVEHGWI